MSEYNIKILKCSDSKLWYANLVGKVVEYLGHDEVEWRSYEPQGYINFVKLEDAELIKGEPNV
jgi:hypothetical protein